MSWQSSSRGDSKVNLSNSERSERSAVPTRPRLAIAANVRWLAAANFGVKPVWFLFLLASTRILGAEQFGSYMFAVSYASIITVILEGGIDIHLIRELSPDGGRFPLFFAHSVLLKMFSGLLVIIITLGTSFFIALPKESRLLLLLAAVFTGFNAVMIHCRAVFRSFEVMQYEAFSIITEKSVVMICCLTALYLVNSSVSFMAAYALAYAIACSFTLILVLTRIGRPQLIITREYLWNRVIRPALPFALMNIFTVIYYRSATLMLNALTGSDAQVGYYNAGYRLVESYMLFPTIIAGPIYPVLVRRIAAAENAERIVYQALQAVLPLSILFAVPIFLFRADFTHILFGDGYASARDVVGIVALSMIPVGLNFIFGTMVAASGRQRTGNKFIGVVTLANLLLNYWLIHLYGGAGAAVTTLLTELMLALSYAWIVRDHIRWSNVISLLWRIAAPVAFATILSSVILGGKPFYLTLSLFLAVLGVGYFGLGVVSLSDIRRFAGTR